MRQRPGSIPGRRLPCSSTSGKWTLTCPPPPWRTCTLLWTSSSNKLRRVEELRGVLKCNRRRSIKDHWRGRVPDLQLRWTAIRGAINVVNYAPSGLWSMCVQEWEKVLMGASEVIGEVQSY